MLNTARVAYLLAFVLACAVAGSNRVANATPQTPADRPPRWPITIPHDMNGLKDCGSDSACFLDALEDGKPAKLQRTRRLSEQGTNIIETSSVQVSNFTDDKCTYFARLENINVTFTDDARAKLRQEGRSEAEINEIRDEPREYIGQERVCVFDRGALVTLMRRWNQDQMSVEDFMRADYCEGGYPPLGAAFFPGTPITHTSRSWWLLQTGKIDEAEHELRMAFTADPAYEQAEAHQRMGEIYSRQGKADAALAELLKAVELNPLDNTAWTDLGVAYARRGNFEKAAEQLQRQIDVNKKNGLQSSQPYSLLCVLPNERPVEKTIEFCLETLNISTGDWLAWNQLAWTYATSKDPSYRDSAKALEYAQKAVLLSQGKIPEILDTLAEAYFVNGNFDEAIVTERIALKLSPDTASFNESLARYLGAKSAKR